MPASAPCGERLDLRGNSRHKGGVPMKRYWLSLVSLAGVIVAVGMAEVESGSGQWPVAGQNPQNTWSAPGEGQLGPSNVASLAVKWVLTTGGDVSATPTVAGNAVYVPDWAGNLYALQRDTLQQIWSVQVPQLDGVPGSVTRVSPAVHGGDLIIGDLQSDFALHNGASLMAVDRQRSTGRNTNCPRMQTAARPAGWMQ